MTQAWDEKGIFLKALDLPPEQRAAFLNESCTDQASRDRIESLLRHHAQVTEGFLVDVLTPSSQQPAQISEFRILHRLGEGGMGVVYLAEDTVLGRKVALKVLARHLTGSAQALARFQEEARCTAQLKHPAIVPVYKFDRDGDTHFIVSEYVAGTTLANLIAERRAKLTSTHPTSDYHAWYRRSAEMIAVAASALEAAHRAKLVHRDVKPSNILIDSQSQMPRLTDFGIAKHLTEESRTIHTGLIGSCHYMSPEQASIAGARVDQRSDIFSLGVVLYELLSLRRPFEGANEQIVLRAVLECAPTRLRILDERVPRDLETICHKAMEKDPARRYQTAAHVEADLRCYLIGAPILARPPGVIRKTRVWAGRHRKAIAVGSTLTLTGAVALLSWTLIYLRSESQAWFSLEVSEGVNCNIYLQRVNDHALTLQDALSLGSTPLALQSVPPGAYRLTAATTDASAFAEFDLLLNKPGRMLSTTIVISEHWNEADAGSVNAPPAADLPKKRIVRARLIPTDSAVASGMGYVPAGEYPYGWSSDSDDPTTHKQTVFVAAFYMDYCEVSNREYKLFCDATGYPQPLIWKDFGYDSVSQDAPVTSVTWHDAGAYARWVGKRLPTMFEWQAAARGTEGRRYPAGDESLPDDYERMTVEAKDDFDSPDGRDIHEAVRRFAVPVNLGVADPNGFRHFASNAREISGSVNPLNGTVVVMGRSWKDSPRKIDLTHVSTTGASGASFHNGFRCAKSAVPIQSSSSTLRKDENNARLSDQGP